MNKKILILFLGLIITNISFSQKVYDETADASKQLDEAILKAKKENKHVFAMVGGNWCKWCLIFNEFIETNDTIKQVINDNFVVVHISYTKQNPNKSTLKRLKSPQRFGFPVFVILNEDGERIHTQNSAYLEKGDGYDTKEVVDFLNRWTKTAVHNTNK